MTSRTTLLLFLALLLVYSSRAVSGDWRPIRSSTPGAALVNFSENTSGAIVTVAIPGFSTQEIFIGGKSYFVPLLDNANPILDAGFPELPALTASLQISSAGSTEISIVNARYVEFTDVSIAPSAGNVIRSNKSADRAFGPVYSTDAFYPGKLFEGNQPYISRNIRCQSVKLFPFQYNPVTRILRVYYDMELLIVHSQVPGANPLSFADMNIRSMKEITPPVLNSYDYPGLKSANAVNELGTMLIICPMEYRSAMEPFILWKTQCGLSVDIADAANFADASQVASFVRDYYYSNGNLTYLLLVGDAEDVPSFMMPYGASDNYYSYIAGNDHYPDILVGRFSASSLRDVEVQVKRSIQYEKEVGEDAEWLGNVTGIASTLSPGDDGESDYEHIRNLMNDLKGGTYASSNEYFDGSQGVPDTDGDPSAQQVLAGVNQGTGLILYAGHGSTSGWATGRITRSAVSTVTNAGMYPMIWSAACETGNFSGNTCLAETWLQAATEEGEPLGAIAALMASGTQTTHPPMEGQDAMVARLAIAGKENSNLTFGGISVYGMNRMNDIYGEAGYITTDTWILFGDPSLMVRTAPPATINATHAAFYGYGWKEFAIEADIETGVACLSSNGVQLGVSEIRNGTARIFLADEPLDEKIVLTITSFNRIPYITDIMVEREPSAVINCVPANHSRRIPISTGLKWSPGFAGKPTQYVICFGTDNPPTNILSGQAINAPHYIPPVALEYNTTYYWRVDAQNEYGTVKGNVHQFETLYGPDEDFEKGYSTDSRWLAGGNSGWSIDSSVRFRGQFSCRSGSISHGESSSLIFPCDVKSCDFIGFWVKIESEDNKDKLLFLLDDVVMGEWSGSKNWTYAFFPVEPGIHQAEWRYYKDEANSFSEDAAWLDDISLPVHAGMAVNAESGMHVCEGAVYTPQAWAENYNSLIWTTDGDGQFSDATLIQPAYTPGTGDILEGRVQLNMKVSSFDNCPEQMVSITIYPESLPLITLPSDTIAAGTEIVTLDGTINDDVSYLWVPGNITSPVLNVENMEQDRGSTTVTLQVTSSSGCLSEKTIRVHFPEGSEAPSFNVYPNPCSLFFNLESENGPVMIEKISLVNAEGKIVWSQESKTEIINSMQFTLPVLPAATYLLIAQNSSGRFVKPLIIQ